MCDMRGSNVPFSLIGNTSRSNPDNTVVFARIPDERSILQRLEAFPARSILQSPTCGYMPAKT
jgi:hypothetical protein